MINGAKILQTVTKTLRLAAASLTDLASNLSDDINTGINLLLSCKRLTVTTGAGKSGFIAKNGCHP